MPADDSWPEVGVRATPATSEALEEWLLEAGALAVTLLSAPASGGHGARADDDIAHAVLEPAPGEVRLWDSLVLVGLFAQGMSDTALAEALSHAATGPGGDVSSLPEYRISRLPDMLWERAWMADFAPTRFGPRFWVCPSHHAPVDATAVTLRLDPGLAFGSGTHATTAQCLEWLGRDSGRTLSPFEGLHVVDYGSGSGVLAIAAALLGAARVHATDIDPQALAASASNAAANGVEARVTVCPPAALEESLVKAPPVDLLLANILLGPLEALADTFADLVRPGGTLVLSGLLGTQVDPVRLRYNPRFDFASERSRDGWALLEAIRRPNA